MPSRPTGSSQTWGLPDPGQKVTLNEQRLTAIISQNFVWMNGYAYSVSMQPPKTSK